MSDELSFVVVVNRARWETALLEGSAKITKDLLGHTRQTKSLSDVKNGSLKSSRMMLSEARQASVPKVSKLRLQLRRRS